MYHPVPVYQPVPIYQPVPVYPPLYPGFGYGGKNKKNRDHKINFNSFISISTNLWTRFWIRWFLQIKIGLLDDNAAKFIHFINFQYSPYFQIHETINLNFQKNRKLLFHSLHFFAVRSHRKFFTLFFSSLNQNNG